jgi:hypothetical protein
VTRTKSLFATLLASLALLLGTTSLASAVYPPEVPTPNRALRIVVDEILYEPANLDELAQAARVAIAQALGISIDRLQIGSTARFFLLSTPTYLGSAVADSDGVVTFNFTVPAGFSGEHTVRAEVTLADGSEVAYEHTIVIVSDIVDTGSNTTGTTLQIAVIALAAGLGMLGLAAIRRRSNTAAA